VPTLVVTFPTQTGDAGYGISAVVVNASGGHFLVYCDEENGYYVYTESTTTWTKIAQAASTVWAPNTLYGAGVRVSNGGLTYLTAAGGTSAAAPATGPSGTGSGIADGTITDWAYTPTINGVNPATFVSVVVWKNRLWFTQKDTGTAWYLQPGFGAGGALFGTATSFNFGAQFRQGGPLVGLFGWSVSGLQAPDDRLVAISGGGDVVIYGGTDPASAATFGIVGRAAMAPPPYGRRIATQDGGELFLMSTLGVLPISRLVAGIIDPKVLYSTYKISNYFSRQASSFGGLQGWAICKHPEDNALVITIPTAGGQSTTQIAMSLVTQGWAPYRGLNWLSMEQFGGKLYFGSADGRVLINTGYLDGLLLSDPNAFTPIDMSGVSRFENFGRGTQKQITQIRPTIISEGGSIQQNAQARFRYDLTEADAPSAPTQNPGNSLWGSAVWDVSKWGGAYATQQQVFGAAGIGPDFAVAFRLSVTSRTVLIGFDVEYTESAGMT
jgi:hypothetical protein